jgi:hypoxanthine phosphoribosyltransferase
MVLELIRAAGADVRTVCLFSKPQTVLEPDYVWRKTSKWIAFPWSSKPPVTLESR